jgi:F420-0:gamma-glutamyl ligase
VTRLPEYVGVSAFGLKIGVVVPGSDIVGMTYDALVKCHDDGLLASGDTVCITESVVARAQDNYVTVDDIAGEARKQLKIGPSARLGVLFPILSRNRFWLVLKGLARAVPEGEVVVQLSHPTDEVGNPILQRDLAKKLGKDDSDIITLEEAGSDRLRHPITQVDYVDLYSTTITEQGAKANIYFSNDPMRIAEANTDAVVVANVHNREEIKSILAPVTDKCITLQSMCNTPPGPWSEWGLLGSNMSSGDRLKLAPRNSDEVAEEIQTKIADNLGIRIEVLIFGDGAYRDPSTGIYELADPKPTFGMTQGLAGRYREGLKYKYIVDEMWYQGTEIPDIENALKAKANEPIDRQARATEGTTPRRIEDVIASLADLVSGSADAGTPIVLVKGIL